MLPELYICSYFFSFLYFSSFFNPNFTISSLKSSTNSGFYKLKRRLSSAYFALVDDELDMDPYPPSLLVINERVPNNIVRTFHAEDQDYLWKFVKLVHIGLSTSNLPEGVNNFNFGGANA